MKRFCNDIHTEFNKTCCSRTIKRVLKKGDLLWKRMRNSLALQRDDSFFDFFKIETQILRKQAQNQEIDLYYFDEVGFSLKPNVPYAWQEKGKTALLPAKKGNKFTVLGLLNIERQEFTGHLYQGAANEECIVKVLEELSLEVAQKQRKTIIILDNATIHTSNLVKEQAKVWRQRGLYLQFIPAYCPELNLIEILWKRIKHTWLELKDYANAKTLKNAVLNILKQYGQEYLIEFEPI